MNDERIKKQNVDLGLVRAMYSQPETNTEDLLEGQINSSKGLKKSKERKTKRAAVTLREQGPYPKYAALAEAINTLPVKLADHRYKNALEYRKSVELRKAKRNALKNEGMRYVAIPTEAEMRKEIKNKVAASIKEQEDTLKARIAEGLAAEKARKEVEAFEAARAKKEGTMSVKPKVQSPAWEGFQPSTFKKAA